jgi:hypothetical protein
MGSIWHPHKKHWKSTRQTIRVAVVSLGDAHSPRI